jgi:hypothetical protein
VIAAPAVRRNLEQFHLRQVHSRSGRTTGGRRDGDNGDRIAGAVSAIAKLQVLILLNANTL